MTNESVSLASAGCVLFLDLVLFFAIPGLILVVVSASVKDIEVNVSLGEKLQSL